MKKFLSVCGLIGAISIGALSTYVPAYAQPSPAVQGDQPPARHGFREHKFDPAERAAHLQKALQLSDEQTVKVKKLFEDNAQKRKAIEDQYKPQFDAFHADMQKLHEQTHTQLNAVLTTKQQQALEAQRHPHGGGHAHDKDDESTSIIESAI